MMPSTAPIYSCLMMMPISIVVIIMAATVPEVNGFIVQRSHQYQRSIGGACPLVPLLATPAVKSQTDDEIMMEDDDDDDDDIVGLMMEEEEFEILDDDEDDDHSSSIHQKKLKKNKNVDTSTQTNITYIII